MLKWSSYVMASSPPRTAVRSRRSHQDSWTQASASSGLISGEVCHTLSMYNHFCVASPNHQSGKAKLNYFKFSLDSADFSLSRLCLPLWSHETWEVGTRCTHFCPAPFVRSSLTYIMLSYVVVCILLEPGRQLDLHRLHKPADAVALLDLDLPPVAGALPVAVRDL